MKEFDAKVISIEENKVILDKTCFYPMGGGQVGDTGYINDQKVIDTRKTDDYTVIHMMEKEPTFKVGDEVHGKIDWERRYKIMKIHSAAHLAFYAMKKVFGEDAKPASSGIVDDRKDKSDYLIKEPLDPKKMEQVTNIANEVIEKDYKIELDTSSENRRTWKIEPYPIMNCGGTHVKTTGEIGKILIKKGKKNPGAGKRRVEVYLLK